MRQTSRMLLLKSPLRHLRLIIAVVLGLIACSDNAGAQNLPAQDLAQEYGFLPVEIYKFDNRMSNLTLADLDGDKVDDVIVSNNGRSRIDILYSSQKIDPDTEETERGVNTPAYDKRMRSRRYSVSKEIVGLVAADLNADGRLDLAYYGTPAAIVVLINEGGGKFAEPVIREIGDGVATGSGLGTGDLNRDGLADLVLLRENELVVLPQISGGRLGDPIRLGHSAIRPRLMKIADFDGDGGDDLIVLGSSEDQPVHLRLSTPASTKMAATVGLNLGPERRLKMDQVRAIGFADLDGKPGQEWMTVNNSTGRGHVLKLAAPSGQAGGSAAQADVMSRFGAIFDYPLPSAEGRSRSLDSGDLDGDGLMEVVVTDPEAARVIAFRRSSNKSESFDVGIQSPSLIGVRSIRIGDLDGDKKAEVYVLSEREKQIGRGVWRDGQLTFPVPLALSGGEPIAFELADIDGDRRPELIYAAKGKLDGKERISLHALKCDLKGDFSVSAWPGGSAEMVLKENVAPEQIQALDVNDDGLSDLLLTGNYGAPTLLVSRKSQPPMEIANLGPLASANRSSVRTVTMDGKRVLMVAQNNFARVVGLDAENRWQIRDQFNASGSAASIQGVAAVNLDGDDKTDLVLYDQDKRALEVVLRSAAGVKSAGMIPLGNLEFHGLRIADFGGDARPDILIEGAGKFSVFVLGAKPYELKMLATYETTERRSRLGDVVAADLGGPVGNDIAWIDIGEHTIHLTAVLPKSDGSLDLRKALSFKVFEEKSFRDVRSMGEPRDVTTGDVDGDKLADIVLIAHDRILIYRQDNGSSSAMPKPIPNAPRSSTRAVPSTAKAAKP